MEDSKNMDFYEMTPEKVDELAGYMFDVQKEEEERKKREEMVNEELREMMETEAQEVLEAVVSNEHPWYAEEEPSKFSVRTEVKKGPQGKVSVTYLIDCDE